MELESDSLPFISVSGDGGVPRLPSSVIVADQKGIIRSVNNATCRLFGYSRDELLGRNIKILMPKPIADQHDLILERYFAKGIFKSGTTRTTFGLTKDGELVKIQLALSHMVSDTTPLISAMIDELQYHSFTLVSSKEGVILSVSGACHETTGYAPERLVGLNVAVLCPVSVAQEHHKYMAQYVPGAPSKVIGHVRNRELRHALGHVIPISLEITELPDTDPVCFSASVTEVEKSMEAVITVNDSKRIVTVSTAGPIMFGYEEEEMIGMPIAKIAPGISLKEGKRFVTCQHKDGSHFFVSVDIQPFVMDGDECYRGVIRRTQPNKAHRQRSTVQYDETISNGDVLDWYEVTHKVLGTGYFGSVKVATHRLTGVPVAIKTLKKKQYLDANMPYPPREVDLMVRLKHPNIFRFFHSICTEDALYMITEVVSGGELFDYAAQHDRLSEAETRVFMRQILAAVDYMHRRGIVHRDLKLENILLDAFGNIKIIDFGLGNFYNCTGNAKLSTFCGSPDYAPPELWEGKPYHGPEVDVWSMGVILFILTTGFIPFNSSSHVMEIRYHWPNEATVSRELVDLVAKIFRPSSSRCSVEDMIFHPWMNDCGRIKHIARTPLNMTPCECNELILMHMEELGLPSDEIKKAVLNAEHNQLSTTYALLEFQLEERLRLRRRSEFLTSGLMAGSPSPSPRRGSDAFGETTEPQSMRNSLRESQQKCSLQ